MKEKRKKLDDGYAIEGGGKKDKGLGCKGERQGGVVGPWELK